MSNQAIGCREMYLGLRKQRALPRLTSVLALTATLGCTTSGTATGQLVQSGASSIPVTPAKYVTFVWRSDAGNPHRGEISVVLPSGAAYEGTYRQVSRRYPIEFYRPMWIGWRPYWSDWHTPWYGHPFTDLNGWLTVYEGRVVARLEATNSADFMRCRFVLDDPSKGLAGGGRGDCQLSGGAMIQNAELQPL
jgi:hypothetical protein